MKYLWIFLLIFLGCQKTEQDHNSSRPTQDPYVLLISLDGLRHDYLSKHRPPFLSQFVKKGVQAKSLQAAFPSKTFPNHLSLVTGMYPGHHGIVANHFYSKKLNKEYSLRDRSAVSDARFYRGVPLWNLARQNGMLSATYFWPGSEADINGLRANYWLKYDHAKPHLKRIEQVINWFKLEESKRPQFVTLYFHDVDSAGHKYGPDSKQVKKAMMKVDRSLEKLVSEIESLAFEVNILIVSDHGMTEVDEDKIYWIDDLLKNEQNLLKKFKRIGKGPLMYFYYLGNNAEHDVEKLQTLLSSSLPKQIHAYKREDLLDRWHLKNDENVGEIVLVAELGYSVGFKGDRFPKGTHGYDNKKTDMHGIFYGKGPALKSSYLGPTIENVHIYPLIAHILGLDIKHQIDGELSKIESFLKEK